MARFSLNARRMSVAGAAWSREQLDRYQLVEKIGRGGMAEVFRARMCSLGGFAREVAIKVLLPEYAGETEFVDMLLDEARIAGAIVHPCVVQVLDIGRSGDTFYLVMEHVRGTDLRTLGRVVPGGKLPLPMALYVVGELLRGLHAVHSAHIIHRDISPANVLLSEAGAVKLGDFGIAHASGRLTHTRVGLVKGKSRYMAPEQLLGRPVDHRADLYAAGVTLFEAILGDVARESSLATPYGPMFTWPRRLPRELVPDDVADILRRAVVEDPRARFADAAAFRCAVAAALAAHAPGYDAEALARQLRQLRGEPAADEEGAGEDTEDTRDEQFLGEASEAATELRDPFGRPKLALVESEPHRVGAREFVPAPAGEAPRAPGAGEPFAAIAAKADSYQSIHVAQPFRPLPGRSDSGRPIPAVAEPYRPPATTTAVYGPDSGDGGLYASGERRTTPFGGLPALAAMPRRHPLLLLLGGLAGAALIAAAITFASIGGEPSLPLPVRPRPAAPQVTPLVRPRPPATGTLAVGGPPGARVSIGTTEYAPAPCTIELLPGQYEVKLRWKRRHESHVVSIEAGATTMY